MRGGNRWDYEIIMNAARNGGRYRTPDLDLQSCQLEAFLSSPRRCQRPDGAEMKGLPEMMNTGSLLV